MKFATSRNGLRPAIVRLIAVYDVAANLSGRIQVNERLRRASRALANPLSGGASEPFMGGVKLIQTEAPEPEQPGGWRRVWRWVRRKA